MKIAVVDASRVVLKIVSGILSEAGHEVFSFSDSGQALDRLHIHPMIDVLITSLQLEGLSGVELTRAAKSIAGHNRALSVIVMSSSSDGDTLVDALDNGADDFIGKPPAAAELLARLRVAERMLTLQRDLIRLATIDALTGALNRRAFFEAAEACGRSETDAVAIFDIDRFKSINDRYGHAAGDLVISEVARVARIRTPLFGRIGGEEFAMLLPGETTRGAFAICEELRADMSMLSFDEVDRRLAPTCSFGVADWGRHESVVDALGRADVALYKAKATGRDKVVAASADV